ncbi:MAG: hypothetical protein ACE5I1_33265 [bacterium]
MVELPEQAEQENLRIAEVTTSSMEVYRHYLDGRSFMVHGTA